MTEGFRVSGTRFGRRELPGWRAGRSSAREVPSRGGTGTTMLPAAARQAVQNVGDARLFPLALMGEVNAERGAQNVAHPDVVPGRNVIAHRFLPRDVRRAPALLLGPEKLDLLLRRWPPAFAEVESHEGLGPDLGGGRALAPRCPPRGFASLARSDGSPSGPGGSRATWDSPFRRRRTGAGSRARCGRSSDGSVGALRHELADDVGVDLAHRREL